MHGADSLPHDVPYARSLSSSESDAGMLEFHDLGVECFYLTLNDDLFNREVLPSSPIDRYWMIDLPTVTLQCSFRYGGQSATLARAYIGSEWSGQRHAREAFRH
jgi:hypothetical protein